MTNEPAEHESTPEKGSQVQRVVMADEDFKRQVSYFRGHCIMLVDGQWLYADTMEPIPAGGGVARPCMKCGAEEWSGSDDCNHPDKCLGVLPGVDNACCGHGIPERAYIRFTNGTVVKGFTVES